MFIKHFIKKLIYVSNNENMVISGRHEVVITRNKHRESWDARNVSSLDLYVHIDLEYNKNYLNCTLKISVPDIPYYMSNQNNKKMKRHLIKKSNPNGQKI